MAPVQQELLLRAYNTLAQLQADETNILFTLARFAAARLHSGYLVPVRAHEQHWGLRGLQKDKLIKYLNIISSHTIGRQYIRIIKVDQFEISGMGLQIAQVVRAQTRAPRMNFDVPPMLKCSIDALKA